MPIKKENTTQEVSLDHKSNGDGDTTISQVSMRDTKKMDKPIVVKNPVIRKVSAQQPIVVRSQPTIIRPVNICCPKCRGAMIIGVYQICSTCNGSRYVGDSVSGAAKTIVDVVNAVRGRERKRVKRNHIPSKIICPTCRASGQIIVQKTCDNCLGQGVICK